MIFLNSKERIVDEIFSIPKGWNIDRMISIGKFYKGKNITKSELVDKGFPCILYSHIYTKFDRIFNEVNSYIDENKFLISTKIKKGDFLFTSSGETVEDIGKCILYNGESNISIGGDIIVFSLFDPTKFDNKFLSYVFNADFFKYQKSSNSNGEIVVHIYEKQLREIKFTYPLHSDQKLISKYLDKKTEKIESLIEKITKKIELLKEQKTALINKYVTKGLDPNIEMKDSGVEWIGEIPKQWEIIKVGYLTNLQQGLQIPFEDRFFEKIENSYEYITTKSVHNPSEPRQYIKNPKLNVRCNKNDILYGRTGNTGEVVTNVEGVFHNNFFKVSIVNTKIKREYLIFILKSSRFKEFILLLSGSTTIPDLNHGDFNSIKIPIPPLSEQCEISQKLELKLEVFKEIILKEEKRLNLIREYRESLVSSVVTGKIRITEDMI